MTRNVFALFMVALLAGCSDPMPPVKLDYASMGTINLATADLQITDRSGFQPQRPPFIGKMFTPRLNEAVQEWARTRFSPVGRDGHASLVILNADLIQQPLPLGRGLSDFYRRQQEKKYIGRLDVRLEATQPNGISGVATAYAVHSISLPENASEDERQIAYRKILDNLVTTLDTNITQAIKERIPAELIAGSSTGSSANVLMESGEEVFVPSAGTDDGARSVSVQPLDLNAGASSSATSGSPVGAVRLNSAAQPEELKNKTNFNAQ